MPLVKVSALPKPKRIFGALASQMHVPLDFDEMGRDEIEQMFYGSED
jgi:hypothetical protein